MSSRSPMPTLFLSHGGGPAWHMESSGEPFLKTMDKNSPSAAFLQLLWGKLDIPRPRAICVISAHWEESEHTVSTASRHTLLFDYYGFPREMYHLKWPAAGSPEMAAKAKEYMKKAGLTVKEDKRRGLDHGVFIPFMLLLPNADIPVFQISLKDGLKFEDHLKLGEALAPLRNDSVLIVGSGQSTHNFDKTSLDVLPPWASRFKEWLTDTLCNDEYTREERRTKLKSSTQESSFYKAHPRAEHFLPLVVAAAAAGYTTAKSLYEEFVCGSMLISHYVFK